MANEFIARKGLVVLANGIVATGSTNINGDVTASGDVVAVNFRGSGQYLTNIAADSIQYSNVLNKPTLVSSSLQFNNLASPFTGSFTGSFFGDGSQLTGVASSLKISGSTSGADTVNLSTETLIFSGSNNVTAAVTNNTVTIGITGLLSQSSQVDVRNTTGIATIATTGSNTFTGTQTINDTTNSTTFNDGALIIAGGVGIAKNVNISGSLTVSGLLTAVSMSTQYVTSSQLNITDNKITVQVNDSVRFGGLSVYDSGSSSPTTASIYWDSLNHKFIYENLSGSVYNSAMFIAGPKNTNTLGNEVGLTANRVPVASGDDHIDSRPESSSIRVDFPSRLTHIEADLYVTGASTLSGGVTIGNSFQTSSTYVANGPTTNEVVVTLATGSYDAAHFDYVLKNGTNLRTGTIMSVWTGASVEFTDTSTNDIGTTRNADFTVDTSSGNVRLKFSATSGTWTIKTTPKLM